MLIKSCTVCHTICVVHTRTGNTRPTSLCITQLTLCVCVSCVTHEYMCGTHTCECRCPTDILLYYSNNSNKPERACFRADGAFGKVDTTSIRQYERSWNKYMLNTLFDVRERFNVDMCGYPSVFSLKYIYGYKAHTENMIHFTYYCTQTKRLRL